MATDSHNTTDLNQEIYIRLAEGDGAHFVQNATGHWSVMDADGAVIARGAFSKTECARLYVEDRELCAATPAAAFQFVRSRYRPHDEMRTFKEGWDTVMQHGALLPDRYSDVDGQAYDRGGLAAIEYKRAIAHLDANTKAAEDPRWLAQLLHGEGH